MKTSTLQRVVRKLLIVAALLMGTHANAALNAISVTSNPNQTGTVNAPLPVNFVFTMQVTPTFQGGNPFPLPVQVLSLRGELEAPGLAPITINTQAGQPFIAFPGDPNNGFQPTTISVNETVLVPAAFINTAIGAGVNSFTFTRTFEEIDPQLQSPLGPTVTMNGTVALQAAPGNPVANALPANPQSNPEILRVDLGFAQGEATEVTDLDSELYAYAELTYRQSGLLDAVWEVAEPTSMGGVPVFRPLNNVRRLLPLGGRLLLRSPALPTHFTGVYLLRFRVQDPNFAQGEPLVRYAVINRQQPLSMLTASGPQRCEIGEASEFNWLAVDGAAAYQLEFFEQTPQLRGNNQPLTGVLVPGSELSARMSALVYQHLQSDRQYYWRITAFDAAGRVIARSEPASVALLANQKALEGIR